MSAADWMLGDVGKPKPPKKIERAPEPLAIDDAVRYLEDAAGDGKALVAGVKKGVEALRALRTSGLTGEALVVLITEKFGNYRTDGGRYQKPTAAQVQCVLEALFRLGEYVRP